MGDTDLRTEQCLFRLAAPAGGRLVAALLTLALLAPEAAPAHGLWLSKRLDRLVLSLGHDDQEDSYPAEKLVGIDAVRPDGSVVPLSTARTGDPYWSIAWPADHTLITVRYRGGQSGQRPDGSWVEGPRGTDPAVRKVGRFDKYLLAILSAAADPATAPATRMQVRPARNPLTLRRGEPLRVQVLFDGKPLSGVAVMADYAANADVRHATTDADGWAEIRVQNQGQNVVAALWIEPVTGDPEIDFVEHLATLSFALRPVSHLPGYRHPAMR
jgi:uncharacterized GH25 family protein